MWGMGRWGGGAYLTLILSISKGRDHCVMESAKCLAGKQGYALKGIKVGE